MCKILAIAGIQDSNREDAWKIIHKMAKEMSFYNNNDGLGYAAITKDNKLFGERWLKNDEAFIERQETSLTPLELVLAEEYQSFFHFNRTIKYNNFGELDYQNISAITLHTRQATSGKEFKNTHPFVEDDTSLIHNGVIRNADKFEKKSTCDSEAILRVYIDNNVAEKPDHIQRLAHRLVGYYACAVFAKIGDRFILDVFKDNSASLEGAFVSLGEGKPGLLLITTSAKDVEDVVSKFQDYKVLTKLSVTPGRLLRIDPITGKTLRIVQFDPRTFVQDSTPSSSVLEYDERMKVYRDKGTTSMDGNKCGSKDETKNDAANGHGKVVQEHRGPVPPNEPGWGYKDGVWSRTYPVDCATHSNPINNHNRSINGWFQEKTNTWRKTHKKG